MEDRQKTKDQLWADLEALRRRLGAWERAGTRQEFFERALRESEARFRALVETVPLGIQLGLHEGVELHVLIGLSFGVGLWPPTITLPLLPPLGPRLKVRISRD